MANKVIAYTDGAGTKYGVTEEESLQDLWIDFAAAAGDTLAAPYNTSYADLAALQAYSGWSGAIAAPNGLQTRKANIQINEASGGNPLTTVQVVVGSAANFATVEPTGATPFPTTSYVLTGTKGSIAGVTGEQRSGN